MSSYNEIIPGLFLGPMYVLETEWEGDLAEKNVQRIVRVVIEPSEPPKRNDGTPISLLHIPILDQPDVDISAHFAKVADFIHEVVSQREALKDAAGHPASVYVHCSAGVSRSCTMVCSYLMIKHGKTAAQALRLVSHQRNVVEPNHGFVQQLLQLEKAQHLQRSDGESTIWRPSISMDEFQYYNYHRCLNFTFNRLALHIGEIVGATPDLLAPFVQLEQFRTQKTLIGKSDEEVQALVAPLLPPTDEMESKYAHLVPEDPDMTPLLKNPDYVDPDHSEDQMSVAQRRTLRLLRLAIFDVNRTLGSESISTQLINKLFK